MLFPSWNGRPKSPRSGKSRKPAHSPLRFELLENRLAPAVGLPAGETFSFLNSADIPVEMRIAGSAGEAFLHESQTDGIGNDDGILEDGEEIGAIEIRNASADFSLTFATPLDSTGVIPLGDVTALQQTIAGIFTEGPCEFELNSYMGEDFSLGGGLVVHAVHDKIVLTQLSSGATLDIRGNLSGDVIVQDRLSGALLIGGCWTGVLTVGEDFDGSIHVANDAAGSIRIVGNFTGQADVGGAVSGKWLIVGSLTGHIHAGADVSHISVIRDLLGTLESGGRVWLDVGGTIGSTASVEGSDVVVFSGASYGGRLTASGSGYLRVAENITADAIVQADGLLTVAHGSGIDSGAQLVSPTLVVNYLPDFAQGKVISSLPYIISSPGVYRLARSLVYGGTAGVAIVVRASNVTIDLQGFSLINAAGSATDATGISGTNISGVTIRNGTIRGFRFGVTLTGFRGSAHVVENIRAEANWYSGLWIEGARSVTRQNVILDTGGLTAGGPWTIPIALRAFGADHRVEDNIIAGVRRSADNIEWVGVHFDSAPRSVFSGNIVAAGALESETWGLWINNGSWGLEGRTFVHIDGNLFVRLETAATYSQAAGSYSNNLLLNVPNGFFAVGNWVLDAGNNLAYPDALVPTVPPDLFQRLAELRVAFGFRLAGSYYENSYGYGEKWLQDRFGRWYALLPNGDLVQWTGLRDVTAGPLVASLDPLVFYDPTRLFNASVSLSPETENALTELRVAYGFYGAASYYENSLGFKEKWFLDRIGAWYALTPDGSLYQWNGSKNLTTSTRLAVLSSLVFDDPNHLFHARLSLSSAAVQELSELHTTYGFRKGASYYENSLGFKEKWLLDRLGAWYALTPDGSLYQWNGQRNLTSSTRLRLLSPLVFDDPNRLLNAAVVLSAESQSQLSQLQESHGFRQATSYYENSYGYREKWFTDRQGAWHVLTPDGSLYRWNGQRNLTSSTRLAVLDRSVFDDPNRLFKAPVALTAAVQEQLGELQRTYGFRLVGSYYENSLGFREKWFKDRSGAWYALTPDGSLYQWNGAKNLTTSTRLAILAPAVFDDPGRLFQALVPMTEARRTELAGLAQMFGFHFTGSFNDNALGYGEKWFQDRFGLWYFLMPNGGLVQWDGTSVATSVRLSTLEVVVFENPFLLFDAAV